MAIGSGTLGLLFKIGVDSSDAIKAIDELKASVKGALGGRDQGLCENLRFQRTSKDRRLILPGHSLR